MQTIFAVQCNQPMQFNAINQCRGVNTNILQFNAINQCRGVNTNILLITCIYSTNANHICSSMQSNASKPHLQFNAIQCKSKLQTTFAIQYKHSMQTFNVSQNSKPHLQFNANHICSSMQFNASQNSKPHFQFNANHICSSMQFNASQCN